MVVDNLLCILSACPLAYGIEVACGDSQHVGIVLHRTLFAESLCQQGAEIVENLVLALRYKLL